METLQSPRKKPDLLDVASDFSFSFIETLPVEISLFNGEMRFHDNNCATLTYDGCEAYPIFSVVIPVNDDHTDRLLYAKRCDGLPGMMAFVGSEPKAVRTAVLTSLGVLGLCRAHHTRMTKSLIRSQRAQDSEMPSMAALRLLSKLLPVAGAETMAIFPKFDAKALVITRFCAVCQCHFFLSLHVEL